MRKDKRDSNQIRVIATEQGLLNRPDGSSRFNMGNTNVICSVYGPKEVKARNEKMDEATIEVIFKPQTGIPGPKEKLYEEILNQTVSSIILSTLHPRSLVSIVVQVVNDDGAILSAAINGVCLALIDAGISMKSSFSSSTCCISKENEFLFDPTLEEQNNAQATFTFAFDGSLTGILTSDSQGSFTEEQFFEAIKICRSCSGKVIEFLRQSLERKIKKEKS